MTRVGRPPRRWISVSSKREAIFLAASTVLVARIAPSFRNSFTDVTDDVLPPASRWQAQHIALLQKS